MDRELLYRLKEGDREAFNAVYWRYSPKVYNTVLHLLNDPDVAEDLTQELFLTLWEKREQIQPELNFEAYIRTITRNLTYHYLENALNNKLTAAKLDDVDIAVASGEEDLEAESLREYIFRVIATFPEMRRKVFIMSRFDRLPHAEIARRLSLSERTVESHIYLALKELRKIMGHKALAFLLIYLSF